MSNYGQIDRRIPTPPKYIRVEEEFNKIYGGTQRPLNKDIFEHEVFQTALEKLDPADKQEIQMTIRQFTSGDIRGARKVKNLGPLSMLELLAKLGIFLNAVERERP